MRVEILEESSHYVVVALVDRSVELEADAELVWQAVKTPVAFRTVTRGLLRMPVIANRDGEWHEGETVVGWVFLFGFVPFSRHHLHIAAIDNEHRVLRSQEHGGLVRQWNHEIEVEPISASHCRYTDRIEIDAGLFTPVVVAYARAFYALRQRRWRKLAREMKRREAS
jgi:hypothetical protein